MLTLDDHDKIKRFEEFTVAHPHLLEADTRIRAFVEAPAGSAMLLVLGPTGAGKSTLLAHVIRAITAEWQVRLDADPDLLPAVAFDCPAALAGNFSWAEWLIEGLIALQDVAPREKVFVPTDPRRPIEPFRSDSVGGLRRAFVETARRRRPPAIGLDEAQHLAGVGHGQRLLTQLDFIKSLADAAGSVFLLVGTYELLALRNLSGQLGRRCQEVHFPRYRIEDGEDWEQFRSVINTFASQLPTDPNLLVAEAEWMYAGSAGCVGTLKQWLTRALVLALKDGSELSRAHLEQTTLSVAARTEIAAEILKGEAAMYESAADRAQLDEMLGLKVARSRAGKSPRRKTAGRVGRRAPHRDPVGAPA